jgi:hypothetical protein
VSERIQHAPTSEIYSRARVGHLLVRGAQMETWLVADGSGEAEEQGGWRI